ncbi:dTDP-4-dehydrorhamnose 3,5-epimerase [Sinorhizobium medicae]|uniref:dTDP-4-dehydrorhamnose 3,5-epimerase n=1 Tax=Sinorhizobium medicae TaxID=110321 RepID=UPI0030926B18|nr:dTDP-4-dehydrorhamnose 3,5-epimerase [Sinorhizobium medicae]
MLEVRPLSLGGVLEIVPRKFGDERGFFSETFNAETLAAQGVELSFVQDNHSYSALAGTLRGLHYQLPPKAQAKLVRVVRGRVFDVVVDIRKGSPSFAKWLGLELSAERWNQILVPAGFAHGFVTLEPETEVLYKVTEHYSAEHERSIRFDDPAIGIGWPVAADRLQLSAKDRNAALLNRSNLFEFTA